MTKPNDHHRALHWVVEVETTGGGGGKWWETIAAFNNATVAQTYAKDCSQSGLKYRVVYVKPPTAHKSYVVFETQPQETKGML